MILSVSRSPKEWWLFSFFFLLFSAAEQSGAERILSGLLEVRFDSEENLVFFAHSNRHKTK